MQLAPYAEDASSIPTPEVAEDEFRQWLNEPPPVVDPDDETAELTQLVIGDRRRVH